MSAYQCAVVTGATGGIGAAIVRALCDAGLRVHATGRRRDRLDALASETGCTPWELDLSQLEALSAFAQQLEGVDVLVNNAGIGVGFDGFFDATPEGIHRAVSVNIDAALQLTRALVPGMTEQGRGHVFNLGSVAGLYPINSALYGATKGAIHLFSQNLRIELLGSGVRCTEICPGRVRTEFFERALRDPAAADAVINAPFELLEGKDIADVVLFALQAPPRVNVGLVEIVPTGQAIGGVQMVEAPRDDERSDA